LNLSFVHVVGQVSKLMLKGSMGCPWVGHNETKEDISEKLIKIYP
jgi:hypothetical protein